MPIPKDKKGLTQQNRKPTPRQMKAARLMAENVGLDKPRSTGDVLRDAGYSEEVAQVPSKVTDSPTFQDLLAQYIPDNKLAKTHARLLETRKIEHMVFPLGPKGEDDENLSGATPNADNHVEKAGIYVERTTLTDQEIKEMLKEVNCVVKRIVHGDTGRHVYYWSHDANAQTKALEIAYKMRGLIDKPSKLPMVNFNFKGSATFNGGDYKK